jgi:hypothetical protein
MEYKYMNIVTTGNNLWPQISRLVGHT